ncbi:ribonuclease P protein component [Dactylosporangium sp. NPDC051485]|uniref:ribonuclease P protein component n=1 Tax=Dactylosporangium sp. NPDC051485 TaxID=3154846 RepID=UPI00342370B8
MDSAAVSSLGVGSASAGSTGGRLPGGGSAISDLSGSGAVSDLSASALASAESGPASGEDLVEPVSDGVGAVRAGFVVSKAVGGAVVRNRVKRRLRHLVRERIADLPAGSVLVVRALPEAASVPYEILARDLDLALEAVRRPRNRGGRR